MPNIHKTGIHIMYREKNSFITGKHKHLQSETTEYSFEEPHSTADFM